MPRPRQTIRLEGGLKLDLNRLARQGTIHPGAYTQDEIRWTNNYTGEQIASGLITADMSGVDGPHGWVRIQIGSLDQRIHLTARPCHFGGWQWYFSCPYTSRSVSVLWMPPGARDFACRQKWGRRVAYTSQYLTSIDRAHRAKARIKSRLCSIGGFNSDDWEFPPKPKWMRWRTYNCAEEKFDRHQATLDSGVVSAAARFMRDV